MAQTDTADNLTFRVRKIAALLGMLRGLRINPTQFTAEAISQSVQVVFRVATQEEELCVVPADWWQAFKERWYPKWLLRRSPVKHHVIWAVHKFPELMFPNLGHEFVHLRIAKEVEK